ncbi:uncharacterized protein LOC105186330 isoform X2 [Harpegnathos saltator]|uniref:uncharacterized protein LOC105186330 isoform X2 n=1 Tax=Harpegnathos saltator TaxID=610380 RepID=UPI000DBEEE05|nr:uncharacterized protein LOC105186330 isoform X2 [Harpegnathos saltator]
MTRDRSKLLLLLLLGLLMAHGLFVVECKYHQREDRATTEARHRHRHRHESSNRRSHHDLDRRSWQEVDYDGEYEDDGGDSKDEDDYEMRLYYDRLRSYQQPRNYHGRMLEPRYPDRYHSGGGGGGGGGYRGSGWYDKDNDRRNISPRYNAKARRRYTPGRSYSHGRYTHDHVFDDSTDEDFDYGKPHRHVQDGGAAPADRRLEWRRNSRRPPPPPPRRGRIFDEDTRPSPNVWRHRLKDRVVDRDRESRWTEYWRRRLNSSEYMPHSLKGESKSDESESDDEDEEEDEDEDYKDHGGLEERDKDDDDDDDDDNDEEEEDEEEEDDIWKIFDDKGEGNDELEELDNDFYKNRSRPALTYDDIIKRLTSDDPITARTTVKRDYRNIEDRYAKRDGYRNLKYESRNITRVLGPYTYANRPIINRARAVSSSVKSAVPDKPSANNAFAVAAMRNNWQQERKTAVKGDGAHSKSKRGDLDNDGYMYGPDNEKNDEDKDMQADVTNTGYTDDDNSERDKAAAVDASATISSSSSSTITTRATSTTPKWPANGDGKNQAKANERGTAAQYSGYQPKNDYPPMSAHSDYKWRTLGTRESVTQTRSNMLQYIKNDPAYREALRYSEKVKDEASCRWPRAKVIRVSDVRPDPSVNYHPHCAILHECSDNTGCCKSDELTCVANKSHTVQLTFYTTSVNGSLSVVKIEFVNHTECGCVNRERYNKILEMQRINHGQSLSSFQNTKMTSLTKPCKCTKSFTARKQSPQDDCECKCQENDVECKQISRGKKSLDREDRECIRNNECTVPYCEFGMYIPSNGKCPTRRSMVNAAANHIMYQKRQVRRRSERRTKESRG